MDKGRDHFHGKDPLKHVVELQTKGILASREIHGVEAPGTLFATCDSAKDTAVIFSLFLLILGFFDFTQDQIRAISEALVMGITLWKFGRVALLASSRLERFHRSALEERHEIRSNRAQEREELRVLYGAKGFEGKLLEDVVDVLMADQDRLLRVMLEEEMGFRLEAQEHPLLQACGAGFGTFIASSAVALSYLHFGTGAMCITSVICLSVAALIPAIYEKNRLTPAIVWTVGVGLLAFSTVYYAMRYVWL